MYHNNNDFWRKILKMRIFIGGSGQTNNSYRKRECHRGILLKTDVYLCTFLWVILLCLGSRCVSWWTIVGHPSFLWLTPIQHDAKTSEKILRINLRKGVEKAFSLFRVFRFEKPFGCVHGDHGNAKAVSKHGKSINITTDEMWRVLIGFCQSRKFISPSPVTPSSPVDRVLGGWRHFRLVQILRRGADSRPGRIRLVTGTVYPTTRHTILPTYLPTVLFPLLLSLLFDHGVFDVFVCMFVWLYYKTTAMDRLDLPIPSSATEKRHSI